MANVLALPQQRINLVVCLQARVKDLLPCVIRRAVPYETDIDAECLERICTTYGEPFLYYDTASTMIVGTAIFNPTGSDGDFRTLLTHIDMICGPREFTRLATR